jgi:hypothetical protein
MRWIAGLPSPLTHNKEPVGTRETHVYRGSSFCPSSLGHRPLPNGSSPLLFSLPLCSSARIPRYTLHVTEYSTEHGGSAKYTGTYQVRVEGWSPLPCSGHPSSSSLRTAQRRNPKRANGAVSDCPRHQISCPRHAPSGFS